MLWDAAKTLRGTLSRSPLSVAFTAIAYFFFAAFFAGFLAAFLAAFFVAIVSILPFHCNSNVAVNECIEAVEKRVKKKIAFRENFFRTNVVPFSFRRGVSASRLRQG